MQIALQKPVLQHVKAIVNLKFEYIADNQSFMQYSQVFTAVNVNTKVQPESHTTICK